MLYIIRPIMFLVVLCVSFSSSLFARGLGSDRNDTQQTNRNTVPSSSTRSQNQSGAIGYGDKDIPVKGERHAVLIGIDAYTPPITNLKFAVSDMTTLHRVLLDAGYPKENVILMTERAPKMQHVANRNNIYKQIEHVLKVAKEEDVVFIAFSGHGTMPDGKNYLCPCDADPENVEGTMVLLDDIYDMIRSCKARNRVFLVDACRDDPNKPIVSASGRSLSGGLRGLKFDPLEHQYKGFAILSSCSPGEQALEDKQFNGGVFTYYMAEGLEGKAADKDGNISLFTLFDYAAKQTTRFVIDTHNMTQIPMLRGELNNVILAKVDPAKVDPAKVESAKVESAKVELAKVEPAKVEPLPDPTPEQLIAMIPSLDQRVRANRSDAEAQYQLGVAYYYQAGTQSDTKLIRTTLNRAKTSLGQANTLKLSHPKLPTYMAQVQQAIDQLTPPPPPPPPPNGNARQPTPLRPEDYYDLAVISIDQRNYVDALTDLNTALQMAPRYAEALALRAHVYHLTKQQNKAIVDIQNAIKLAPNNREYIRMRTQIMSMSTGR